VNTEPVDTPPAQAPLLQQVVFTFDSNPDPNSIGNSSIQILDENGFPVPGRFVVEGPVVTFTPVMPTRPVTIGLDGTVDDGGADFRREAPSPSGSAPRPSSSSRRSRARSSRASAIPTTRAES